MSNNQAFKLIASTHEDQSILSLPSLLLPLPNAASVMSDSASLGTEKIITESGGQPEETLWLIFLHLSIPSDCLQIIEVTKSKVWYRTRSSGCGFTKGWGARFLSGRRGSRLTRNPPRPSRWGRGGSKGSHGCIYQPLTTKAWRPAARVREKNGKPTVTVCHTS